MKQRIAIAVAVFGLPLGFALGHHHAKATAFDQGFEHGCQVAADINNDNDETLAACIESERG